MTLVDSSTIPSPFVPRIHGWKPIPSARILRAADIKKQKDCPLCNASDDLHSIVWHAYGGKDVTEAVRAAQDNGIVGVTPELVRKHFPNHNYLQPSPLRRLKNEEMVDLVEQLPEREQKILLAVYRQRVLSSRQIADLFFLEGSTSETSANKSSYRSLNKLRFNHCLYQYRTQKRKSPDKYYFLGRYGAPWVELQETRLVGNAYVTRAQGIDEYFIEHDSLAADVYIQMRKQLFSHYVKDQPVVVDGTTPTLSLPTDCWYGARSLNFGYFDPLNGSESKIIPDGFGALSVNDGRQMQYRLPFFYEWDSGSKPLEETVDQLMNYVGFSLSGAVGKRFPRLDAPGYFPPILMVTKTAPRAYKLAQLAREAGKKYGSVPSMFITSIDTLQSAAFTPRAWINVHGDDQDATIAEHLLHANSVLNEKAPIHWRLDLEIDLDAARPKTTLL